MTSSRSSLTSRVDLYNKHAQQDANHEGLQCQDNDA